MVSRVSILGAGPAGFALAADLQKNGTDTLLYSHRMHLRHAQAVMNTGRLHLSCVMEGFSDVRLTTDIEEAVAFSRYIILTVPSTGQLTLLDELRQHNLRRHTIIAVPGNLISLLKEANIEAENILETNLSPYACRMDKGNLLVFGRKKVVFIAAHRTSGLRPGFYDKIQSIFPMKLRWCVNVLEVFLSNVNGVFHPIMILMNAGRIENTAGDFLLYHDGLTRSVANAMLAIDRVRMETASRFGLNTMTAVDISNECYGQSFADLVDLARNSPPHNKLVAPADVESRNITEDVGDVLVCWHDLAEKVGIDASPIAAVITLAEMATGTAFVKTGRTLDKLHVENLRVGDMGRSRGSHVSNPYKEVGNEARL